MEKYRKKRLEGRLRGRGSLSKLEETGKEGRMEGRNETAKTGTTKNIGFTLMNKNK